MDYELFGILTLIYLIICSLIFIFSDVISSHKDDIKTKIVISLIVLNVITLIPLTFGIQLDKEFTKLKEELFKRGIVVEKVDVIEVVGHKYEIKKMNGENNK